MSTVITVEKLGKKYLLNHQAKQESYVALRDVIADTCKNIGRKFISPFSHFYHSPVTTHRSPDVEEFWALKDVSFEVKQGDRIGIIGRNGAGKSTLLKILSRITEPTTGRVRIRGRVASLLEVGTGFHPELTGRENIFLNGAILGMNRAEIRKKFDEIVAFAEIEKFLDTPVKRYSSGMYVRLAFAVAAHLEPEILVVDEVLAVGDTQFQKKCLGKMEQVGRDGRTVLFVSHNMAAVNNLCGGALWLEQGGVRAFGPTTEIVRDYLLDGGRLEAEVAHSAPDSARVALRRVWTETLEGEACTYLDVTRPFRIVVSFQVRVKVSDVDLGIWIRNFREMPVCFTNLSEVCGGALSVLEPGSYRASFEIPELFLVPDVYRLMAKAHVPNVMTEDLIPGAGEFSVVETGSALARYSDAWKNGVVLGNFPWTLTRADQEGP